jgi:diguanylate cyclase (GGDEF)-like protein
MTDLAANAATDLAATAASPAHSEDPLRDVLLESRQRWRDFVVMTADLVFETDAAGRLVFVTPDPVLGWSPSTLIGQPAELLLADVAGTSAFNPFRPIAPLRRRRAWLRRADGGVACLVFAAAPLRDEKGDIVGARGIGVDLTEQDGHEAKVAAALRRGEVIEHILSRMRQEVMAPRMMTIALEALQQAVGAEGIAVIDADDSIGAATFRYQLGAGAAAVLDTALRLIAVGADAPIVDRSPDKRPVLVASCRTRDEEQVALALWRVAGGRAWDAEDRALAASASGIVRVVLEHESIQREMSNQARTDPLTGLFNRRAFLEEIERRIERLDREGLPGTLMFADLDNFKPINDQLGHEVGDQALCMTAALLRITVRPADLVARLGGDEFALWLDGADHFTAAERAEDLRVNGPRQIAQLTEGQVPPMTMSIGIASRLPGSGESIEQLMRRADHSMYQVKRAGRAHWRVALESEA